MAMIQVCCVVDVRVADFDEGELRKILAAFDEVDAVARLELEESSVGALPRDGSFRVNWATGSIAALRTWSKLERSGPSYATLDVDGCTSPRVYVEVLEELFDAGVCPLVRPMQPHGVDAVAQLQKLRAPILASLENDALGVSAGGIVASRVRLLPAGVLMATKPIRRWKMDGASLRAALGEIEPSLFVPSYPQCFSLPDGSKLRQFIGGGTMAASHSAAQLECQASLGFEDRSEFEAWLAEVARDEVLADRLPVGWRRPASRPFDDERRLSVSALPQSLASAIVLAGALLRGARVEVEEFVGLRVQLTGASGFGSGQVFNLTEFDDPAIAREQEDVARRGLDLVASACGMIARCRAPDRAREAAAKTLAFLGVPHARRVFDSLDGGAASESTLVHLLRDVWRNGAARRLRERIEHEVVSRQIAKHLDDQVDKLLKSLAGAP